MGRIQLAKTELMATATSAARAAALELSSGSATATNAAILYGGLNKVDGTPMVIAPSDVSVGTWDAATDSFTVGGSGPNAVRVTATRAASRGTGLRMMFGSFLGIPTFDARYTAFASNATDRQLDVSASYNQNAATNDGMSFSGGGLDGGSYAYSAQQLLSSVTHGGWTYQLGPAHSSNSIRCTGQTIPLSVPAATYKSLILLAGAGYGPKTGTVTIGYYDGSQSVYSQVFSDWGIPGVNVARESIVLAMTQRNRSNGTVDPRPHHLYAYEFPLTTTSRVTQITLPNETRLKVFGVGLIPCESFTVR